MIRLSLVLPSYRDNLTALARISQACSWAGPHTEVIVRDNSGSASKARFLANIRKENCRLIVTDPCGGHENWWGSFAEAKGEFIFFLSDDDFCFNRAVGDLPGIIAEIGDDASVVGITGAVMIDSVQGANLVSYSNLDADLAVTRLSGYLDSPGWNVILFSPIRREVMKRVREVILARPFKLSFDDQLHSLLYLLAGKFVRLNRLLYTYDPHNWETHASAQAEDVRYYTEATLDPAVNKLHWFLCAFEGATLIRNLDMTPNYSLAERQAMADRWFAMMFARFKHLSREGFGSRFSDDAEKLCAKWKAAAGQLSFESMLADICQFMALASKENALKYFAYWSAMIGLRQAPAA